MSEQPLTFEAAFAALEETVRRLEEGGLDLETSVDLFAKGMKLARFCEEELDRAELRVQQLLSDATGHTTLVPFEGERDGR